MVDSSTRNNRPQAVGQAEEQDVPPLDMTKVPRSKDFDTKRSVDNDVEVVEVDELSPCIRQERAHV